MIAQRYLDEFDYLGERAYLDCATMGLPPRRTLRAARDYLDDYAFSFAHPAYSNEQLREDCRERLARLIHADAKDIFFTQNTTQGNNLLPDGYPLAPGDEVLLSNGDFPSVWIPWTRRQRDGVKLVFADSENGVVSADSFLEKITDKTRVIALSWVQSSSGYTADLARLGRVCREKGIVLAVDGIQGMGRLPMDVEAFGIDLLSSGSFKGLLGTQGAGFCWCRPEIMARIDPPLCSGNVALESLCWDDHFTAQPVPTFAARAARMETGTFNNHGIRILHESVGLLLEIGVDAIAARIRELERYYRRGLAALDVALLGSPDEATWSGSVSFHCPEDKRAALSQALEAAQISAAVRSYCRVGLHYYNTQAQLDRMLAVLSRFFPPREKGESHV